MCKIPMLPTALSKSNEFIHNAATSYYCIPCKEKFQCKKTDSKKDKKLYEKQFKQSGVPLYELYYICDFFDLNKIYDQYNSICECKLTIWGHVKISSNIVSLFEFGTYQFLEETERETNNINELKLDDMKRIIKLYDDEILYEEQELSYNTFTLNDLLNITLQDQYVIKQRNKSFIKIVSKFNIFTGQDSLDDLFSFRRKVYNNIVLEYQEKRYALYRQFADLIAYTYGYIIDMYSRYLDSCVKFFIKSNNKRIKPGDIQKFIN
ncbi:14640_t:CDS:2, partial [Cetraspora pellucida]